MLKYGKNSIGNRKIAEQQDTIKAAANKMVEAKQDTSILQCCKSPLFGNSLTVGRIPAEVETLLLDELRKTYAEEEMTDEFLSNTYEAFFYEACEHLDDDGNDMFAYDLKTHHGEKRILYKDQHPTIEMEVEALPMFAQTCIGVSGDGLLSEEDIVDKMTVELAEYCVGGDIHTILNVDLSLMPEEMRQVFTEDAHQILNELRNHPKLLAFLEANRTGGIAKSMLQRQFGETMVRMVLNM